MILDTDILVGLLRNDAGAIKFLRSVDLATQDIFITSINAFELYQGAYNSDTQEKSLILVADLMQRFERIFDMDVVASRLAGEIVVNLKKKGTTLDLPDIFIGSIALAHNESIVTRNIDHFKRIPGLKMVKW